MDCNMLYSIVLGFVCLFLITHLIKLEAVVSVLYKR